ncbi:MAG: tetratricopeptide repeat protein [Nitrospinaceae bacterium]
MTAWRWFLLAWVLACPLSMPGGAAAQDIESIPERAFPPQQMGETLLRMGQFAPAQAIYRKLFATEAKDPQVVRGLVKAHAGLGELPQVRALLESYLEEHPDSSAVLYGLGLALYLQKEAAASAKKLRLALAKDPENSLALITLAVVLHDKNEDEEAVQLLHRAIAVSPGQGMIYRNLWRVYKAMGKTGLFFKEFETARQAGQRARVLGYGRAYAVALRQEGFGLYQKGDPKGALQKMESMVQVYRDLDHLPGVVSGLFSLALLQEESGNVDKALALYREILQLSPEHIQAGEKVRELAEKTKNQ